MIKTQKQVRSLFWQTFPHANKKKIKDYSGKGKMYVTDTRVLFCDFLDSLRRAEEITEELAQRCTL